MQLAARQSNNRHSGRKYDRKYMCIQHTAKIAIKCENAANPNRTVKGKLGETTTREEMRAKVQIFVEAIVETIEIHHIFQVLSKVGR